MILPTDTVYGVSADPENREAVQRLYDAKGRGEEKPLQLLLGDPSWLDSVAVSLTPEARRLAAAFFPGGITLVVKKGPTVPDDIVSGGTTVGVRVPDHPLCLQIVKAFGRPLAASSANKSGKPSPRTAQEAAEQLGELVDLVFDGGPSAAGRDSTVIDATDTPVRILREGAVAREEIERVLGGRVGWT